MTQPGTADATGPNARPAGVGLGVVFYGATALLGLVNLFLGFTTAARDRSSSLGYYGANGILAWIPALLFLGGLLAVRALLRGAYRPDLLPALVTTAVMVPFVFTTIKTDRFGEGLAVGEIMFLIFGLLQLVTSWLAALLGGYRIGSLALTREPAPTPPSAQTQWTSPAASTAQPTSAPTVAPTHPPAAPPASPPATPPPEQPPQSPAS